MKDLTPPAIVCRAEPSLDEISNDIREHYILADNCRREGVEQYAMVGKLLLKAKARLPHGEWINWVERNTSFGDRKARRYMALAKSDAASDLETAWAIICGHKEAEEKPPLDLAPENRPTPRQREPGDDDGEIDALDIPFDNGEFPIKGRVAEAFSPVFQELNVIAAQKNAHDSPVLKELRERTVQLQKDIATAYRTL